jgi:hypothetical protein
MLYISEWKLVLIILIYTISAHYVTKKYGVKSLWIGSIIVFSSVAGIGFRYPLIAYSSTKGVFMFQMAFGMFIVTSIVSFFYRNKISIRFSLLISIIVGSIISLMPLWVT